MNRIAGLIALAGAISVGTLVTAGLTYSPQLDGPILVAIPSGSHEYRASGEYLKDSFPVNAPMITVDHAKQIDIMKYQVSTSDYALCIADGACKKPYKNRLKNEIAPITGVSYDNAVEYAHWYSEKTGVRWRLPSDKEWSYVAGSRFVDDAITREQESDDPSVKWLEKYRTYAELNSVEGTVVRDRGFFGENENGLVDLSGNVWEWTSTCYKRSRISDDNGALDTQTENCGVRIAEGQHRAYITTFVQDAKGGGCAVGAPPNYLGFRLVKDTQPMF
ncbi:MAG: SUMF1/EgtB/PvdO family nonheme iron enzyme, partial [Rhizobiales bacterium]|nr:SUMF1/EgtB/PvdO family nonheme iron enzyme [Hyphomicrobiales bacterium]